MVGKEDDQMNAPSKSNVSSPGQGPASLDESGDLSHWFVQKFAYLTEILNLGRT